VRYSAVPLEASISFASRISAWSRRNFESAKFPTKGKGEGEREGERKREGGRWHRVRSRFHPVKNLEYWISHEIKENKESEELFLAHPVCRKRAQRRRYHQVGELVVLVGQGRRWLAAPEENAARKRKHRDVPQLSRGVVRLISRESHVSLALLRLHSRKTSLCYFNITFAAFTHTYISS